jgi:hypothetical protein
VAPPIRQSDTIDLTGNSPPVAVTTTSSSATTAGALATRWSNLKEKRKCPISLKELFNAKELPINLGLDNNNIRNNWTHGILVKVETKKTMTWKVMTNGVPQGLTVSKEKSPAASASASASAFAIDIDFTILVSLATGLGPG